MPGMEAMLSYVYPYAYHSLASHHPGWLQPYAAVIHPSWKDSRAAAQVKDGLVWFVRLIHFTDLLGSLHRSTKPSQPIEAWQKKPKRFSCLHLKPSTSPPPRGLASKGALA
ncbi:MAG: hypothetical protein QXI39_04250 [Candidatus Bathyarchaeia archaeon]